MMRVIASLLVIIVIGSQNKLCRANTQCPNNSTLRIKRDDDDSCAEGGIPDIYVDHVFFIITILLFNAAW